MAGSLVHKIYNWRGFLKIVMVKDIKELREYDLELDRIIEKIQKEKAKKVLLQFPDGLKPYANSVVQELEKRVSCEFFIWLGSCYGACDVPDVKGFDLLIQFGHSPWKN